MQQNNSFDVPDHVFDALEKMGNEDRKAILESDFIQHILPIIAARGTEETFDISNWVNVAGTPHAALNVLDDNTREVIFVLPPVLARIGTLSVLDPGDGVNVNDTLLRYGAMQSSHDLAAADAMLFRDLGPYIEPVNREYVLSFLRQWVPIYRRYNLDLATLTGITDPELAKATLGEDALNAPAAGEKPAEAGAEEKEEKSADANPSIGGLVDF